MIGKLTGSFGGTTPEGASIIEVGGVGYAVYIPLTARAAIEAAKNAVLLVHTAVR